MEGLGRDDSANDFGPIEMSSFGSSTGTNVDTAAAPHESSFRSFMGNNIDVAAASDESNFGSSMENIDIGFVESDLRSSLDSIVFENSLLSTKCSIFETPRILFRTNEKTYVPTAFSIGPLHHGKPGLTATEQIKLKYTQDLISRVSQTKGTVLKDMVKWIACIEEEARQCYAVPVEFTRDEFIKILLVDGCFLIELFRKYGGLDSSTSANDPVMNRACMLEVVDRDLFLLENQIPWMVLHRLFSLTSSDDDILIFRSPQPISSVNVLTRLTLRFFRIFGTRGLDSSMETSLLRSTHYNETKHVLDLLRSSLIGSTLQLESGNRERWELIPSASSLIEAGVKFKKGSTDYGILDIKFSNGVLEIPPFIIHESTEALFRNMISLEQCYHLCDPRITNYAMLLDILINTPKDIDILCKYGIIKNWLNPEKASQIFDNLYSDTYVTEFYYLELSQEVNKYCKRRWPRWRAMYVRNHFSSPWAIASQMLAAIIFILALLQTVFTIKM
ncbi:UPF0481 protein At3g47200-like [Rosa rugosa]|uniref:UPF0481 protein At3g47200-like n=1 Tax=Rosa rugosa TaxID=74645 RepID=UPI002B413FEA|nr:UPF0481 protein At3g47200-like [Rosa rugosa]